MLEGALFALVRSTLLEGFAATPVYGAIDVRRAYQPSTVGVPSGPTIFMQTVLPGHRVGWVKREDFQPVAPATDMVHRETQWWETTLQISGLYRLTPAQAASPMQPGAVDLVKRASDILQGETGMLKMGALRVRPLRITDVRNVHIVNDSDQYEANPSFDITLSYVQITDSTTRPVELGIVPNFGRV